MSHETHSFVGKRSPFDRCEISSSHIVSDPGNLTSERPDEHLITAVWLYSLAALEPLKLEERRSICFGNHVVRTLRLLASRLDSFPRLYRLDGWYHQIASQVRIRQNRTYVDAPSLSHGQSPNARERLVPILRSSQQAHHSPCAVGPTRRPRSTAPRLCVGRTN